MLDEKTLDEKLTQLEAMRTWSPRMIARLEALLRSEEERKVANVNPLEFAREHRLAEGESIDLFLCAAHAGLMEMQWRVLCPGCGLALERFSSLRHVDHRLYCELCHVPVEVGLDDFIQVVFSVSPRVRELAFHRIKQLSARQLVLDYRMAAEARLDGGGRMRDLFAAALLACEFLEVNSVARFSLKLVPGVLSLADPFAHADCVLPVEGSECEAPQRVVVTLAGGRFVADAKTLRPGPLALEVHNHGDQRGTLLAGNIPDAYASSKVTFDPFLTGGRVLASATFRRLFRTEVIQASEGIGVREVTVLFTDLKGSTALYEKIGDLAAFTLVRQHFERLAEVVQAFDGAVVKTIGDAVMAVFSDPARAVKAASRMLHAIDGFNAEGGAKDLVLKIGLHRGPSIAVTLNDTVDYFGQTVNVASRVQSLAEGQEICFTDAIDSAPGVAEQLRAFEVRSRDEKLKGVEREVRVFAARRNGLRAAAA
jgi:class 3 adenylate cyclase